MLQLNADGDVIDIALHTVKFRTDKTITTIPTKRFISDSFKTGAACKKAVAAGLNAAYLLINTAFTS